MQDLRLEVRRDGEREPHVHAARVALDRRVEELLDLGEGDDLVELAPRSRAASCRGSRRSGRCSRGRSARGGSRCRPRAALPTRPQRSDLALGRLGDAREDLQQRALAGAVAADDADHLAARRPRRRRPSSAQIVGVASRRPRSRSTGAAAALADRVAQRVGTARASPSRYCLPRPVDLDDRRAQSDHVREGPLDPPEVRAGRRRAARHRRRRATSRAAHRARLGRRAAPSGSPRRRRPSG